MPLSHAPWTTQEVKALKRRQADRARHPYTCGTCGTILLPQKNGWYCPCCKAHNQSWACLVDIDDYSH